MINVPEETLLSEQAARGAKPRVKVFVDYWNFQLSLSDREASERGRADYRFEIDWRGLGAWLARKACDAISVSSYSYDGVIVFTSYDKNSAQGAKFRRWCLTWLDRQPGVKVECFERKPKPLPKCPACYQRIAVCPHCTKQIAAYEEKGVDTALATDMIRLAWEESYEYAVLATSDQDLVPAVKLLNQKGRKVIQAGFPPLGVDIAGACWASFDVYAQRREIMRKSVADPALSA